MKEYIIWSSYINKNKSRKLGRKVPKDIAINNPKLSKILGVIRKLGYEAELIKNKKYPKEWWDVNAGGYIKVKVNENDKISKLELLKKICSYLNK